MSAAACERASMAAPTLPRPITARLDSLPLTASHGSARRARAATRATVPPAPRRSRSRWRARSPPASRRRGRDRWGRRRSAGSVAGDDARCAVEQLHRAPARAEHAEISQRGHAEQRVQVRAVVRRRVRHRDGGGEAVERERRGERAGSRVRSSCSTRSASGNRAGVAKLGRWSTTVTSHPTVAASRTTGIASVPPPQTSTRTAVRSRSAASSAIARVQRITGERLELHVEHAAAAESEAEHFVVRAARVVVRQLRRAGDEQLRGARHDVRLETATAHRADRAAVGAHDHARSGAAVRRAVDVRRPWRAARPRRARPRRRVRGGDDPARARVARRLLAATRGRERRDRARDTLRAADEDDDHEHRRHEHQRGAPTREAPSR